MLLGQCSKTELGCPFEQGLVPIAVKPQCLAWVCHFGIEQRLVHVEGSQLELQRPSVFIKLFSTLRWNR
eukprot:73507-Amphidinium_carterae.1